MDEPTLHLQYTIDDYALNECERLLRLQPGWKDRTFQPLPDIVRCLSLYGQIVDNVVVFGDQTLEWLADLQATNKVKGPVIGLLRHYLSLLDGLKALLVARSEEAAIVVLRAMFETTAAIVYMVSDDSERRAKAYETVRLHALLRDVHELDATTEAGMQFRESVLKSSISVEITAALAEADSNVDVRGHLESILGSESFLECEQEYLRVKARARKWQPIYWYSFFGGPPTLRKLADATDLAPFHATVFVRWSRVAHSLDVLTGRIVLGTDEKPKILPLRSPIEMNEILQMALLWSMTVLKSLYEHLLVERRKDLGTWHRAFHDLQTLVMKHPPIVPHPRLAT